MYNVVENYPEYIVKKNEELREEKHGLKITSLGVTSLLFDDGETKILFDGMVTRPGLLKTFFCRLDSKKNLVEYLAERFHMQDLKAIFVSHTHYDHILDVPNFAKLSGADVYGSKSTLNVVYGNGVKKEHCHLFLPDSTFTIGDFKIKVLKSIHSKPGFYNNDLGKEVEKPLKFPAKMKEMPEGGSYDFYIEHRGLKLLIRPSCNYIVDSLDDYQADVLFLGIGGLFKLSDEEKEEFYKETVGKVKPSLFGPVHWDG
ncbi:MAG: MBL fold metallo-hydrolase, partial [Dorea sp.]|nr:MBL fold metallo-hydrolase [Dorea sp.]